MNKIIVCAVLFAAAGLLAEASQSLNGQVENKQETVAPKAEPSTPARIKKAPEEQDLAVQAPVPTPQVKEEVVVAEKSISQASQIEPLKEKTEELEAANVSVQSTHPMANEATTTSPKAEPSAPARVKRAPKKQDLAVQAPVLTPQVKEEVVVAKKTTLDEEVSVVEALKEPSPQVQKVDPLIQKIEAPETGLQELEAAKVSVQAAAPIAMEEPVSEAPEASSVEEAPVLQIEATEPVMSEPAAMEPAQTTMDKSETQRTSMSTKKEEKLGSSRFANIAIATVSAAVVIVATILSSN